VYNTHDWIQAHKTAPNDKARILLEIGREKEDLRALAQRALNGDIMLLQYATTHIHKIRSLNEWLDATENAEDPVDEFNKFVRPKQSETQLYDKLEPYGETPELHAHRTMKLRHETRRLRKFKK